MRPSRSASDTRILGAKPLPRIARRWQWAEEACFHLMNRGHDREPVFADDEDRAAFLGHIDTCTKKHYSQARLRQRAGSRSGEEAVDHVRATSRAGRRGGGEVLVGSSPTHSGDPLKSRYRLPSLRTTPCVKRPRLGPACAQSKS